MSHDIFEGTEQIQQLVIARAISGLRMSDRCRGDVSSKGPPLRALLGVPRAVHDLCGTQQVCDVSLLP